MERTKWEETKSDGEKKNVRRSSMNLKGAGKLNVRRTAARTTGEVPGHATGELLGAPAAAIRGLLAART